MGRGNVRVRIDADADGLKKGVDGARSTVRTGFLSMTKSGAGLATGFFGVQAAAGAMNEMIMGSVQAAAESEASSKRLEAQLDALNISYSAHADEIDKVIQKTSKLAGLDDEDLQDAFTGLVRSTGSVSKSLGLVGLASDLARGKQMDVAKAGEVVAKVANGNVGVLKRYGIAFDPVTAAQDKLKASTKNASAEQIAAAKAADKQATSQKAIAELQQRFGGQAEAYGKTQAGAVDRAKVAWENLQETLGAKLAPTVTKAANTVADFVNGIQDGTGAGGRFADKVKEIADDLEPTARWLGNAAKQVAIFTSKHQAVQDLAIALLAVGAGIKALKFVSAITGFNNIVKVGGTVAKKLVPIFAKEGAAAGAAAGQAAAGSEGLLSAKGKMSRSGNLLGSAFGKALKLGSGIYIASVIADLAGIEDANPLLALDPPAAGEDPKTEQEKLKQYEAQGLGGVPDTSRYPKLTKKPKVKRGVAAPISSVFGSFNDASPLAHGSSVRTGSSGATARVSSKGKAGSSAWPPGKYSQAMMADLWAAANPGNGDPDLMAAIGMAESGGNSSVVNSIGAGGLWQIHPPEPNYLDPWTNAKIAGRKLRTQGLGAWEAYTGPDARGSDGPYRAYMGQGGGGGGATISVGGATSSTGRKKRTRTTRITGAFGNVPGEGAVDRGGNTAPSVEFTPDAPYDPSPWIEALSENFAAQGVAASLTPGTDDDLSNAKYEVVYWNALYQGAVKTGNRADQINYGGRLKAAQDTVAQLTPTMEDTLGAEGVAASLTTGKADDLAAASHAATYYQGQYNAAVASGNVRDQVTFGNLLKGAQDTVTGLTPTQEDYLNADLVKAGLTPDGADDAAAQAALKGLYQTKYDEAVAAGDPLGIIEWGQKLKAALEDNTAALQQQNDLLKQQVDLANRRANTSEGEMSVLGRAFGDWMSGELGGRVGPGFQTPAAPGVSARY